MKQPVEKSFGAVLAMALLCAVYLCGNASAASLVVLDLAEIVDQTVPSAVEVFTETKQVSSWFQGDVTEGAGSGVVLDRHSAGDTVRVELVRSGQQIAANVTLTEKGPE